MYFKALLLLILIVAEQASCLPWPFFKPYWGPGRPYPFPFNSGKPHRPSPPCTRSCTVAKPKAATVIKGVTTPYDSGKDVLQAVRQCNPGGRVHFEKNQTYSIGTALDLTNLKNVDLDIQGTIKFTDNIDYWVTHSFKFQFQNISTFWVIGGHDVNVYGGGTIDGSGQTWWTAAAANTSLSAYRPALVGYIGFYGGSVSDLTLIQPPNWFHFVANATDVVFDGLNLTARGTGPTAAQNSDGWDTYRSDNIVIQNSVIQNGDDCVAFKPNSTNIIVQNLHCNGSHGISVGSLGQYAGEVDIVENIFIYNTSLSNATDGARIKVWPGISPAQVGLDGVGGGIGYVRNVTYDTMHIDNDALDIELQQCYGAVSVAACSAYPSNMTISNVHFKNFWGVVSKQNDPEVGSLVCSSPLVCSDIYASNITVTPPSGKSPQYTCTNVNVTELGLPCTKS